MNAHVKKQYTATKNAKVKLILKRAYNGASLLLGEKAN